MKGLVPLCSRQPKAAGASLVLGAGQLFPWRVLDGVLFPLPCSTITSAKCQMTSSSQPEFAHAFQWLLQPVPYSNALLPHCLQTVFPNACSLTLRSATSNSGKGKQCAHCLLTRWEGFSKALYTCGCRAVPRPHCCQPRAGNLGSGCSSSSCLSAPLHIAGTISSAVENSGVSSQLHHILPCLFA